MAELTFARTPVAETMQNLLVHPLSAADSAGVQGQNLATNVLRDNGLGLGSLTMIVPFKERLAEALVGPLAPPAVILLRTVHSVHIRRRCT